MLPKKYLDSPWLSRSFPFFVYIFFIIIQNIFTGFFNGNTAQIYSLPIIYTIKTVLVAYSLIFFWNSYDELSKQSFNITHTLLSFFIGVLVFVLWINMEHPLIAMEGAEPYNPNILPQHLIFPFFAVRLFGAAIIVPIFEELFWRSFILRYIINQDFKSIKIGTFTLPSFLISSILFGLEHNLWLAGIMAGVFYNYILYKTKNLYYCIFAHGITNLFLGLYIIRSGNWQFW